MPRYHYKSAYTTVIVSATTEDNADTKLAKIVREPNMFDLIHREV